MRDLQRTHLDAIVAIGREGSVHAAARSLRRTQPALSRLLNEAETLLGTRIFERSSAGTRPTALGERLLDEAQFVLAALRRLTSVGAGVRPVIALGCIPRAMHTLMPVLLERLYSEEAAFQPQVAEGSSAALVEEVARGTLDFAIARHDAARPAGDTRLAFDALYQERTVVICGKRNRAVPARAPSLAALARLPWVLPASETASRASFERFLHAQRAGPIVPVIEARSFESNLAIVAGSSHFLSIAPEPIARRHAVLGGLRIVNLPRGLPASRIALVYTRHGGADPILAEFREIVREVAALLRRSTVARK